MFRGRIGTIGLKQVENQMKPNKCDFCTLLIMLYFCTENERNLFSIENRPVGFYTECLLKPQHISKRINLLPFYVIQSSISLSLEVQPCIKNELTFRNRRHHRLVRKRGSKLTVKTGTKRQISLHQGTT